MRPLIPFSDRFRNALAHDLVDFNVTSFGIADARFLLGTNQCNELGFGKGS